MSQDNKQKSLFFRNFAGALRLHPEKEKWAGVALLLMAVCGSSYAGGKTSIFNPDSPRHENVQAEFRNACRIEGISDSGLQACVDKLSVARTEEYKIQSYYIGGASMIPLVLGSLLMWRGMRRSDQENQKNLSPEKIFGNVEDALLRMRRDNLSQKDREPKDRGPTIH